MDKQVRVKGRVSFFRAELVKYKMVLQLWITALSSIISTILNTIKVLKGVQTIYTLLSERDLTISEVKNKLDNGALKIGDTVTIIGLFSQYLPFVDLRSLLKDYKFSESFHIFTTRLSSISNIHCAALYQPDEQQAQERVIADPPINEASPCVPLFYSKYPFSQSDESVKLSNHSTGEILELRCKVCEIPDEWSRIISPSQSFSFEGINGATRRFGLRALDVNIYGLSDWFLVNTWIVGHASIKGAITARRQHIEAFHKLSDQSVKTNSKSKKMDELVRALVKKRYTAYLPVATFTHKSWKMRMQGKLSKATLEFGMCLSHPNLIELLVQNVNVCDLGLVDVARDYMDLEVGLLPLKVDFQYDQINPLTKQTISFS